MRKCIVLFLMLMSVSLSVTVPAEAEHDQAEDTEAANLTSLRTLQP